MISCNGDRLRKTLVKFSTFGATENDGVTRLSLSKEDIEARNYFCKCCEESGMETSFDDMGNIYAVLPGKRDFPPIVMGSHLDSVKKGGRFDGVLGVLTALEVVRTFRDHQIEPEVPIMIIDFTNEEGARFEPSMMASGVLTNKFNKYKMLESTDKEGISFETALKESGYEGSITNRLKEAAAYIELHIEQGPVLESKQLEIGVVEGVVGMVCYEIVIKGESNHAGTTPMSMRKDPLFLAAAVITDLRKKLGAIDDELVFTIGRMNVTPNIHTVIPDQVIFTLEARHKDPKQIAKVEDIIFALPKESERCTIEYTKLWGRDTVEFDTAICDQLETSCKKHRYSYKRMYSGAGHDAQFMSGMIPSAMIFVPSINGKSHCEEEQTSYEDCAKGANILLETVWELQRNYAIKKERI